MMPWCPPEIAHPCCMLARSKALFWDFSILGWWYRLIATMWAHYHRVSPLDGGRNSSLPIWLPQLWKVWALRSRAQKSGGGLQSSSRRCIPVSQGQARKNKSSLHHYSKKQSSIGILAHLPSMLSSSTNELQLLQWTVSCLQNPQVTILGSFCNSDIMWFAPYSLCNWVNGNTQRSRYIAVHWWTYTGQVHVANSQCLLNFIIRICMLTIELPLQKTVKQAQSLPHSTMARWFNLQLPILIQSDLISWKLAGDRRQGADGKSCTCVYGRLVHGRDDKHPCGAQRPVSLASEPLASGIPCHEPCSQTNHWLKLTWAVMCLPVEKLSQHLLLRS